MSQEPGEGSESWQTYDPGATSERPAPSPVVTRCPACGGEQAEEGFLEDRGEGSGGSIRWIVGPLEYGIFGGTKKMGRTRLELKGRRCTSCGHVSLFANGQV